MAKCNVHEFPRLSHKCENRIKKQRGFIMIQVLLGLAVLIAIMTGWAYYQNRVHKRAIASRMTNEISYILEAATSYYSDHNEWPDKMADLINAGYIDRQTKGSDEILDPYGQKYVLDNSQGDKLYLLAYIPEDDAYVARNAMTALPFAKFDPDGASAPQGYDVLQAAVIPYGHGGIVKNATIVPSGTIIDKPICPKDEKAKIYTSVASGVEKDGSFVGGYRTYADNLEDEHKWKVHMQVLTNGGWVDADKDSDAYKIEVFTTCQKTDSAF
ncbi:MAG: type II secretion system protein [Gammaproteobacteria bacterium]